MNTLNTIAEWFVSIADSIIAFFVAFVVTFFGLIMGFLMLLDL